MSHQGESEIVDKEDPAGRNYGLLREFDLSRREAEVYLGLLRFGPTTVRKLSQQLKISRVDMYRTLGVLTDRGLAVMIPAGPAVYEAGAPKNMVKSLLTEIEQKARKMKGAAPELILELDSIEKTPNRSDVGTKTHEFKFLKGQSIWSAFENSLGRTRRNVSCIWTISHMNEMGSLKPLSDCAARGIKIRIISEITRANALEAEAFSRMAEIRHYDGILSGLRFTIFDDEEVQLGVTGVEAFKNPRTLMSLWSNRHDFVRLFTYQFDAVWRRSTGLARRLRTLKAR